jgi:NSS family neurotransmitter:Na+ symporter
MKERERWPNRLAFLFAAATSAIGLGNVWRFPYLTYKYGGGAFLLPYLIALVVAGIPLIILEFALGQKLQRGAVDAFASIRRRFNFIGWFALFIGFIVISYYTVVMGWSIIYCIASIGTQYKADTKAYFFDTVLQLTGGINQIGGIVFYVFIAMAISWLMIYFSVWKGTRSVSLVLNWSVPISIILLILMIIRALSLKGAISGIVFYLKPDFKALFNAEVWIAAFSQVFFSLSVGFGILIAYASFNPQNQDIAKNAIIVGLADALFSILAGFVIFGTLGFMAEKQNVEVSKVVASGPGLAFVVFPKALSLMPFASIFSLMFFLMLVAIAYDSAFSLVEAIDTVVMDKTKIKREKIALIVCALGFVSSIIFTTGAGLYFLDIIDHFVNSYSLILVGILECIAVGWILGADKLKTYINEVSDIKIGKWWNYTIKYIIPIVLTIIVIIQLKQEFTKPYGDYPLWAICLGWTSAIIPLIAAFLIPQKKTTST